jgi:RIO-like serine/threonine protein kinase
VVPDSNICEYGHIQEVLCDTLSSVTNTDPDMSFMHNDLTEFNCIVDDDNTVGLLDWKMASFLDERRLEKPIVG